MMAFTGVDLCGLEAAKEKKIAVSNASGYSNESVAELVLGMAIDLFRKVPQVEKRAGKRAQGRPGRPGAKKRAYGGIISYGAIGSRAAELIPCHGLQDSGFFPDTEKNVPDYYLCDAGGVAWTVGYRFPALPADA